MFYRLTVLALQSIAAEIVLFFAFFSSNSSLQFSTVNRYRISSSHLGRVLCILVKVSVTAVSFSFGIMLTRMLFCFEDLSSVFRFLFGCDAILFLGE